MLLVAGLFWVILKVHSTHQQPKGTLNEIVTDPEFSSLLIWKLSLPVFWHNDELMWLHNVDDLPL